DLVVAALAVWRAGGAYLPLDPDYPGERLRFMLADSGASVLLGHRAVAEELAASVDVTLWLEDPLIDAAPGGGPLAPVDPGQAAYVIYTSGSTGRPKGVVVSHRNLVNFLTSMAERTGLDDRDVLLAVTTLGFDIAGLELFLPLLAGGRLIVADRETTRTPQALAAELGRHAVTVLQATPATWQMLIDNGWAGAPGLRALCGGEVLPTALARAIAERTSRLWNVYGPTETTIWSSCDEVTTAGDVTIGSPIANTQMYILGPACTPVPAGVAGDLFIGGAGLARGYRGRPDLTAERFVADPFADDGSRLYRTGDRARWRADGRLEYLGRADNQVKVRGFRIEPGEIEAVLQRHEGIAAAVVGVFGRDTDRRLVAYVVPAEPAGGLPPVAELRELARGSLPGYMVPAVFVELAALPRTPNGKLDRAALPAPDGARPGLAGGFAAPRTVTEELLAGIWCEVLGVDRVGAFDDFFELGGHSLLATRVASRAQLVFGVEVAVAAVFDEPTLAGLAQVIDAVPLAQVSPIVPVDRDRPLPLSFGQQRLWFLAQLEPGSVEYNAPLVLPWDGPLDV
ncbi:MAG TPA: amino acid adenylation domain-containing protein, partial [Streptosporangiaceae bacterium]|nr:amino acid adenylation domain-containing protein [Streptosporangiaceae bacterium]